MEQRSKTFVLTGNTNSFRPILRLILELKGFKVSEYPAKGTKGLICGDAHIPSQDVKYHTKYKKAICNDVPVITMDDLPSAIGITHDEMKR